MRTARIRDLGIKIGELDAGPVNSITDVEGVTVGQVTLSDGDKQTGVTAIVPHQDSLFEEKLIASSHVINGFGKTMGTIQLNELGSLETPIVLTNTLSIGTAAEAVIDYMLERHPQIGRTTGTVNPVIGECNDMILNDIRAQPVKNEHVRQALNEASKDVKEGSVGAGTGMVCYSLKGGVGTSSRVIHLPHGTYTVGVLVITNFGKLSDLSISGHPIGKKLSQKIKAHETPDKGSVMIIVACDLPVSQRQLNRILKRSVTGLSRTGSIISNGSGDIAIGFSTAAKIPHEPDGELLSISTIHEEEIDHAFRAAGEAVEEAVLNSLTAADSVTGRDGNYLPTLMELLHTYQLNLSPN
ncbi:P1 family peptidase [Halobacillus sp. Marseille-Q1614]|uniref:DmpA family aminopeptidase n=1 Tax=Halobacillus sp. Marseille-Q1614 TaxID=2709134 RepID=UPI00156F8AB6|nr:P1 family peptidase [Halobacillus sp. Marseille-Q1614]